MRDTIRVLVVDQSVVYRQYISEALLGLAGVEVAGVAASGRITLAKLGQMPVDLILFDVEMDKEDVLETWRQIRRLYPGVGLVPLSGLNSTSVNLAITALEMGALDLLTKPDVTSGPGGLTEFRSRLELVLRVAVGKKHAWLVHQLTSRHKNDQVEDMPRRKEIIADWSTEPQAHSLTAPVGTIKDVMRSKRLDVVAMGVSTGGPKALGDVIPELPGDLGVPILLVQHMPPLFTGALAGSLNKRAALEVKEAEDGEEVRPNNVYIAPGGRHMVVEPGDGATGLRIGLRNDPPVNSCRPAADVLFKSVAEIYGPRALAVVMTGMGNDGLEGVRLMKTKGGHCLTQTEETCVVYGMPRVVDEAGLSDEQVPLGQLARRIEVLIKRIAERPE